MDSDSPNDSESLDDSDKGDVSDQHGDTHTAVREIVAADRSFKDALAANPALSGFHLPDPTDFTTMPKTSATVVGSDDATFGPDEPGFIKASSELSANELAVRLAGALASGGRKQER